MKTELTEFQIIEKKFFDDGSLRAVKVRSSAFPRVKWFVLSTSGKSFVECTGQYYWISKELIN